MKNLFLLLATLAACGRSSPPVDPEAVDRETARVRALIIAAREDGAKGRRACIEISDERGLHSPLPQVLDSLRSDLDSVFTADECRRRGYASGDMPNPPDGFYVRVEVGLSSGDPHEEIVSGRVVNDTTRFLAQCTIIRDHGRWRAGTGCSYEHVVPWDVAPKHESSLPHSLPPLDSLVRAMKSAGGEFIPEQGHELHLVEADLHIDDFREYGAEAIPALAECVGDRQPSATSGSESDGTTTYPVGAICYYVLSVLTRTTRSDSTELDLSSARAAASGLAAVQRGWRRVIASGQYHLVSSPVRPPRR